MSDEVFKVKLGLNWCGWGERELVRATGLSASAVHSALSGNARAQDRATVRRAITAILDELDRQCRKVCAKYGVAEGDVLRCLDF